MRLLSTKPYACRYIGGDVCAKPTFCDCRAGVSVAPGGGHGQVFVPGGHAGRPGGQRGGDGYGRLAPGRPERQEGPVCEYPRVYRFRAFSAGPQHQRGDERPGGGAPGGEPHGPYAFFAPKTAAPGRLRYVPASLAGMVRRYLRNGEEIEQLLAEISAVDANCRPGENRSSR